MKGRSRKTYESKLRRMKKRWERSKKFGREISKKYTLEKWLEKIKKPTGGKDAE